jgi:uracil-DNA glycosylase family 4
MSIYDFFPENKKAGVVGMYDNLEQLRQEALQCRNCGLCTGRHNVVFGVGHPDARIMLIGEGPGENEDLQGEPFVGRSGQLMDKMLEYAGFSRKTNIYIANMVKCRPPQNRDPAPEEIAACLPWLRNQVSIIRPAVIVCVGRIAATSLIQKDFKVTKQHGQFIDKNGTLMMGTFHPAALLRNPANKPAAMEDLLALAAKAREMGILT